MNVASRRKAAADPRDNPYSVLGLVPDRLHPISVDNSDFDDGFNDFTRREIGRPVHGPAALVAQQLSSQSNSALGLESRG